MPTIDESLSWGRVVISYTTLCAVHKLAFHCRSMSVAGAWDTPSLGESTVFDTATELCLKLAQFLPAGTTFNPLTVFKNNPAPTPTEFWLTGAFDDPATMPSALLKAANTITLNFRTIKNRRAKIVMCDTNGGYSPPTLVLPGGFPPVTETLFSYIILNQNIVTIDGEDIAVAYSVTVDVNETLARRYGVRYNTIAS